MQHLISCQTEHITESITTIEMWLLIETDVWMYRNCPKHLVTKIYWYTLQWQTAGRCRHAPVGGNIPSCHFPTFNVLSLGWRMVKRFLKQVNLVTWAATTNSASCVLCYTLPFMMLPLFLSMLCYQWSWSLLLNSYWLNRVSWLGPPFNCQTSLSYSK